jgi:2-dehydropantoate 2-reductase
MLIAITGAGAIGNYIGCQLYEAGQKVIFKGTDRVASAVNHHGLGMTKPNGTQSHYRPGQLQFTSAAQDCDNADLFIITVKSQLTETVARELAPYVKPGAIVLTLQNGIANKKSLEAIFPDNQVYQGMVTFNVVENDSHLFSHTTSGEIYLDNKVPEAIKNVFLTSNFTVVFTKNIIPTLWSKLLLNLVNPLNALSGKPLKQNLEDRDFRQHWAACYREGLLILKEAGISPTRVTPLPAPLLPFMLELPNWIFLKLAKKMTDMDPSATSSMAQDLNKGKSTEIDYLNGEIIRLAEALGMSAPLNQRVVEKIREKESLNPKEK